MPSRYKDDPYGVNNWDDGYEYIRPESHRAPSPPSRRFSPPPPDRGRAMRSSKYDPPSPGAAMPRPPIGDRSSKYDPPSPGAAMPRPPIGRRASDIHSYGAAPPRTARRRSPSPVKEYRPRPERNYSRDVSPTARPRPRPRPQRSPSPPPARRYDVRSPPRSPPPPYERQRRPSLSTYPTAPPVDRPSRGAQRAYSTSPPPVARSRPNREMDSTRMQRPDLNRDRDRDRDRPRYYPPRASYRPPSPPPASRARPAIQRSQSTTAKTAGAKASSGRWQKAAKAALQAGSLAALNMRSEPGAWAGEKGVRVAGAALGAAALDAFTKGRGSSGGNGGKGGSGRRNSQVEMVGSALGGLLINQLGRSASKRDRK